MALTITQSSAVSTIFKHLAGTRPATREDLDKAITVLSAGADRALSLTLLSRNEHTKALTALEHVQVDECGTSPMTFS